MAAYFDLAGGARSGFRFADRHRRVGSGASPYVLTGREGSGASVAWPGVTRLTADEVAAVRFRVTTFGEGYRRREVDAFLARAALSLREKLAGRTGPVSADDVVVLAFRASHLGPGYVQREVDDFLDRVVEALA